MTVSSIKLLAKASVGPLVLAKPWPKLHLISDIHLETGPYEIPADLKYDILVAAGDISNSVEQSVPWLAAIGKPVVFVLGNHEYWGPADLDGAVTKAKLLAKGTQVRVLERDAAFVEIEGYATARFLGATLFTNFGNLAESLVRESIRGSNDFHQIKAARYAEGPLRARVERLCRRHGFYVPKPGQWHPVIAFLEHQASIMWLEEQLKQPYHDGPTICVSHHSPSFQSLRSFGLSEHLLDPANWHHGRNSQLMRVGNYASDLSALLSRYSDGIDLFCHGHLHEGIDVLDSGVRVLCNPRGYYEKPLSSDVGALWALFGGWPVSDDVIKRSQERQAANPFLGDSFFFDRRLVIDFTEGHARPLAKVIFSKNGPLAKMRTLRRDAVRISAHLTLKNTVPAECVRQVFVDKCTAFTDEINSLMEVHVKHLVKNCSAIPYLQVLLCPKNTPKPHAPFAFPGQQLDLRRDYLSQLDWMARWIAWTKAVPWTAKTVILEWQSAMDSAVKALDDVGIAAWHEPLGSLSLRQISNDSQYLNLYVLKKEDIETATMTLDAMRNTDKILEAYFVNIGSLDTLEDDEQIRVAPLFLRSNSSGPIQPIDEIIHKQ